MDKKKYIQIRNQLKVEKPIGYLAWHFVFDIGLLAMVAIAFWAEQELFAILPLTTLMFRNFTLMHDAVHMAVSNNRTLNNFVGEISGCLCFLPFETWKRSHLDHHIWSGNIEKDPVMALRISLPKASPAVQHFLSVGWNYWIPILAALQYVLFWKLCLQRTIKEASFTKVMRFALPVLFWASVFNLSSTKMLWFAIVPSMVLYLIAVEVVNFPHHLQLPMTDGETRHPVWEQYKSSRTCLYPRWFARFFVLNFNYHTEHHMFPDAPWHMLEEIHHLVKAELKSDENIDTNLEWIMENRPKTLLKVIEPEQWKKAS